MDIQSLTCSNFTINSLASHGQIVLNDRFVTVIVKFEQLLKFDNSLALHGQDSPR